MAETDIGAQQAVLASSVAALTIFLPKAEAPAEPKVEVRKEMKQTVPTWLAIALILLVIAVVAGIFMLGGRTKTQKMPEGFKPKPPMFKEAPTQKR